MTDGGQKERNKAEQPVKGSAVRVPVSATEPRAPSTRLEVPGIVFVKAVLTILITLFLIGFFRQVATVVVMLALALILAAVLEPVVAWLERHGIKRGLASLISLLCLVLLIAGLLALVLPPIISQGIALADDLPNILNRLRSAVSEYPAVYNAIEQKTLSVQRDPSEFFSGFLRVGVSVLSAIVSGLLILTLALYFLTDKDRISSAVLSHVPEHYRARVARTMTECASVVRAYFAGQAIISGLFATFAFLVLFFLGVPYAGILAAFAFVLDAIPNIGNALATVLAGVTALATKSATSALIVVIAFQAYNLVENNLLSPRILGNRLNIPAVLTLTAILIGGQVLGVIGVILAIPLAGMVPVIDRIWFTGDQAVPPPQPEALPQAAD